MPDANRAGTPIVLEPSDLAAVTALIEALAKLFAALAPLAALFVGWRRRGRRR